MLCMIPWPVQSRSCLGPTRSLGLSLTEGSYKNQEFSPNLLRCHDLRSFQDSDKKFVQLVNSVPHDAPTTAFFAAALRPSYPRVSLAFFALFLRFLVLAAFFPPSPLFCFHSAVIMFTLLCPLHTSYFRTARV